MVPLFRALEGLIVSDKAGTQTNNSQVASDSGAPTLKPVVSLTRAAAQRGISPVVFALRLTVSCLVIYLIPNRKPSVPPVLCLLLELTGGQGETSKEKDRCQEEQGGAVNNAEAIPGEPGKRVVRSP